MSCDLNDTHQFRRHHTKHYLSLHHHSPKLKSQLQYHTTKLQIKQATGGEGERLNALSRLKESGSNQTKSMPIGKICVVDA